MNQHYRLPEKDKVILSESNFTELYSADLSDQETIHIPPYITKVPDSVFTKYFCYEGIQEIGVNDFSGCSSLESITVPSQVKEIKDGTFNGY